MRLNGKHCVITGGSSGIGAASVRRFAAEVAEVLIAGVAMDKANALAEELGAAVTAVRCDVCKEPDVMGVAEAESRPASHRTIFRPRACHRIGFSAVAVCFLQAPDENTHLLFSLLVAIGARGFDTLAPGSQGLLVLSQGSVHLAQFFPRGGVIRILFHR